MDEFRRHMEAKEADEAVLAARMREAFDIPEDIEPLPDTPERARVRDAMRKIVTDPSHVAVPAARLQALEELYEAVEKDECSVKYCAMGRGGMVHSAWMKVRALDKLDETED